MFTIWTYWSRSRGAMNFTILKGGFMNIQYISHFCGSIEDFLRFIICLLIDHIEPALGSKPLTRGFSHFTFHIFAIELYGHNNNSFFFSTCVAGGGRRFMKSLSIFIFNPANETLRWNVIN